jgi:preprotein translocase subunit SecA
MSTILIKALEKRSSHSEYISYKKIIDEINNIDFTKLSKSDMLNKSIELKNKLLQGTSMDDILVDAFALVKEAIRRVLGLTAYDEQLAAAIAMHRGKLIEMQTGEGKTLTAVFTAYLNALTDSGCHILTFNDYLAKRDAAWMGPIYEMLGLTVGYVQDTMNIEAKRHAYYCDITYVTAKVAGFDYLRDNLCYDKNNVIHRPFNFAIVDEADSIIVDEARIPLVIAAGGVDNDNTLFITMEVIKKLIPKVHYDKDEYERNAFLTEAGLNTVESMLCIENLYAEENYKLLSEVHNCLYAMVMLKKDVDYIIRDNKIEMVDEFTGRVAENRHWPDGIQAALETKEKLGINSKGRIMSQITLQSFICLYKKLAGMTATAMDSAEEIKEFYDLETMVIPSHTPCIRKDHSDVIFTHKAAKFKALIAEIVKVHATGQPILIGTCSVKESEYLAEELKKANINCNVLNAKNDELEANIIEQAGILGAVTVSTNMAGRGADIKLGGPKEINRDAILSLGGLYVIGTNRHESLRIDKQLRGRSGRQGDPGMSRFFISLEDDLIKQYGIDRVLPEIVRPKNQDEALSMPRIAKKVSQVQRIVQGQNSDLRRVLWQYSSIVENQRLQVHQRRREILLDTNPFKILNEINPELYAKLLTLLGEASVMDLEKQVALYNIDESWADYLAETTTLQEGIHLKVIGGKQPLQEFQIETAKMYQDLQQYILDRIIQDFENMELTKEGVNVLKERIKPPSSTWTYLVKDNSIMDALSLIFFGSAGSSAASILGAPLIAIVALVQSLHKPKHSSKEE